MTDTGLVDGLRSIDSPTLSNAIERLGVRNRVSGFADLHLRHLTPSLGVMCGYAVTARAVTMAPESADRSEGVELFGEICRHLEALGAPGVVVIEEAGPHGDFAVHCGDVMATLFSRFGAVGVVSDCAVRDLEEVLRIGVHLFARGAVASHGNFHIVEVGQPVAVCGLRVETGDLLHGDANGLLSVPEDGRDRLADLAAEVVEREDLIRGTVKDPAKSLDEIKRAMTH